MRPGLTDSFGRQHSYLRVSVTDRCNFRCQYCMPEQGMQWMPRTKILDFQEIVRLVSVFQSLGIRRVRLTGGEPTLRRDVVGLVQGLGRLGLDDLSLTTNAYRLAQLAEPLHRAGLRRVNISLDSLQPDRFEEITRGGKLHQVLEGVEAALETFSGTTKINCVMMKGVNEDELLPLVEYFSRWADRLELRFIEYMPFEQRRFSSVPSKLLRERLREAGYRLTQQPHRSEGGPAQCWTLEPSGLSVGFITPLSKAFCTQCNRLRLMADGNLRTCLSDDKTPSLRDALRSGDSDEALRTLIRGMVLGKREGHGCEIEGGRLFEGVMTRVGG